MFKHAMMVVGMIVVLACPVGRAAAAERQVRVESGMIEGVLADGVLSFKGIPYAAPPVDDLRWRAPQPAVPWKEVRSAHEYGSDCMQKPQEGDLGPIRGPMSEDCLFINVWRPVGGGDALPVMVWIHGGGFVNGGSSPALFDGSAFARQGVLLVSFNYRLGRFGFFAHPALSAAAEGPLGNYGYMDQHAALRWVQRNIRAFGGDPAKVTVFGESAGGVSVLDLLASHPDEGLYQQAIVMSGGGRGPMGGMLGGLRMDQATGGRPSAEQTGIHFARSAGITGSGPEALAALRALPVETLVGELNMGYLLKLLMPWRSLTYAMGPIIDGHTVQGDAGALIDAGKAARVPLIIGTTGQDLGFEAALSKRRLFAGFDPYADQARQAYDPDGKGKLLALSQRVGADRTMDEPARFVARGMANAGNPAWLYRFYYVAESGRGNKLHYAGHASELAFLFDTLEASHGDAVTENDRRMAHAINTYFAGFAKTGKPSGEGFPGWVRFDPARPDLMRFTLDDGPVVMPDPWQRQLDLVEKTVPGTE